MVDKVICTGGAGRLGQHVARRLAPKCKVTIVDRVRPADADLAEIPFVEADIRELDALRAAFEGHDSLVHLAAIPNPRTAPPEVTFQTILSVAMDNGPP